MTEQDFFNDHEQDAEGFKGCGYVVLIVIGVILGMVAVNIYF